MAPGLPRLPSVLWLVPSLSEWHHRLSSYPIRNLGDIHTPSFCIILKSDQIHLMDSFHIYSFVNKPSTTALIQAFIPFSLAHFGNQQTGLSSIVLP